MIWRTDLHPGETPAIADPDLWQKILTWLGEAGMNLLAVALIIVGAMLASWVLRLVIRRVVDRIVSGAKTKANVDDTQALERSPSPRCGSCNAPARSGRSCRTSSM